MQRPFLWSSKDGSYIRKDFRGTGYGALNCTYCRVTEAINGEFELECEVLFDDKVFPYVKVGNVIVAPFDMSDQWEPFEIYKVIYNIGTRKTATVYAWHVSYRLQFCYFISRPNAESFTINTNPTDEIISQLHSNTDSSLADRWLANYYRLYLDYAPGSPKTIRFKQEPTSFRELIFKTAEIAGAEIGYNGYEIHLKSRRGADRGVIAQSGVNIKAGKIEVDGSNIRNAMIGYFSNDEASKYSDNRGTWDHDTSDVPEMSTNAGYRVRAVDLKDILPLTASYSEVTACIQSLFAASDERKPVYNISAELLQEDQNRTTYCVLGDTLQFVDNDLGFYTNVRITKTVYNVLTGKYDNLIMEQKPKDFKDSVAATLR